MCPKHTLRFLQGLAVLSSACGAAPTVAPDSAAIQFPRLHCENLAPPAPPGAPASLDLLALVDTEGGVEQWAALEKPASPFAEAAIATASRCRFTPARIDRTPVRAGVRLRVTFGYEPHEAVALAAPVPASPTGHEPLTAPPTLYPLILSQDEVVTDCYYGRMADDASPRGSLGIVWRVGAEGVGVASVRAFGDLVDEALEGCMLMGVLRYTGLPSPDGPSGRAYHRYDFKMDDSR
jgi:hypothetical protein